MSKHDLQRRKQNLKTDIEKLEKEARLDPLQKKPLIHQELDKLRAKLKEFE